MEVYDKQIQPAQKQRPLFLTWLGTAVMLVGVILIFFIAALEGTKTIKATNRDSVKILQQWRNVSPEREFAYPKEMEELFSYQDKEYYFVIDKVNEETNEIMKWHFAYDGGIGYIFKGYKFYVLTILTIIISVNVGYVNFITTINRTKEQTKFVKSLQYYQKEKERISEYTPHLQDFCIYKKTQGFEEKKREIVESADIKYNYFLSEHFNEESLKKWQKKRLKKIKKIKIQKFTATELLQEGGTSSSTKVEFLPQDQETIQRNYLIRSIIEKTFSSFLGGFVVGFGFILGEWFLGLTYGFTVFMSFIGSIILATNIANTTIRGRIIAKADYLNEFYNMKETFINAKVVEETIVEPIINNDVSEQLSDIEIKKDNSLTTAMSTVMSIEELPNIFKELEVTQNE